MYLHTLDPGMRCGFCFGDAGAIQHSDVINLRKKTEPQAVGLGNLAAYLCQVFDARKPDLLVYEEPLSVPAWFQSNRKRDFPTNAEGVESALRLEGVILAVCIRYGVQYQAVRRQSVLKMVTGASRYPSRADGKKAVIAACKKLGLVDASCNDDDKCDAIANHVYASGKYAGKAPTNFGLFR